MLARIGRDGALLFLSALSMISCGGEQHEDTGPSSKTASAEALFRDDPEGFVDLVDRWLRGCLAGKN